MSRHLFLALLLGACRKQAPLMPVATATDQPADQPAEIAELVANFERVHFDFDEATLGAEAQRRLKRNAEILSEHPDIRIEVQGHADERGTTDYNLALGAERARAVVTALRALGVAPDRVVSTSFGEEEPRAQEHTELAWAENRRAEFRITWASGTAVVGTVR
jgi:peptidoglycan-associated lipoprotein